MLHSNRRSKAAELLNGFATAFMQVHGLTDSMGKHACHFHLQCKRPVLRAWAESSLTAATATVTGCCLLHTTEAIKRFSKSCVGVGKAGLVQQKVHHRKDLVSPSEESIERGPFLYKYLCNQVKARQRPDSGSLQPRDLAVDLAVEGLYTTDNEYRMALFRLGSSLSAATSSKKVGRDELSPKLTKDIFEGPELGCCRELNKLMS